MMGRQLNQVGRIRCRRGFSLIEAVLIVLMISIALPPSIAMMTEASASQADRVLLATAMSYAQGLTDQITADVSVNGLDILTDENLYLDAPGTGFWARVSWVSSPYESRNLAASIAISELVDYQGVVSAIPGENLFRIVTVTIDVPTADGVLLSVPVPMMLGEPNP
jgi:type II secretory pathway pseudopilin PulG